MEKNIALVRWIAIGLPAVGPRVKLDIRALAMTMKRFSYMNIPTARNSAEMGCSFIIIIIIILV